MNWATRVGSGVNIALPETLWSDWGGASASTCDPNATAQTETRRLRRGD